jgi:hypothetical protein
MVHSITWGPSLASQKSFSFSQLRFRETRRLCWKVTAQNRCGGLVLACLIHESKHSFHLQRSFQNDEIRGGSKCLVGSPEVSYAAGRHYFEQGSAFDCAPTRVRTTAGPG